MVQGSCKCFMLIKGCDTAELLTTCVQGPWLAPVFDLSTKGNDKWLTLHCPSFRSLICIREVLIDQHWVEMSWDSDVHDHGSDCKVTGRWDSLPGEVNLCSLIQSLHLYLLGIVHMQWFGYASVNMDVTGPWGNWTLRLEDYQTNIFIITQ